jgi:signal transduction histidine kinase
VTATDHVLVFDSNTGRAASIAALLGEAQPWPGRLAVVTYHDLKAHGNAPSPGQLEIRSGLPALAVVVEADGSKVEFPGLVELARSHGVPTLVVVDPIGDPRELARRVRGFDGWVALDSLEGELPARVAELLDRVGRRPPGGTRLPSIDPRFLALIVHDLRTPLNVIGLTIRAISHTVPQRSAELDEDLTFLQDNALQIEKMLAQLADYCRLIERETDLSSVEFDPRRYLSDFLEDRRARPAGDSPPIRLELSDDGPVEVALDPTRVRLALLHALANAVNAAGEAPVRLRSGGGSDRWVIELIVDKPPPPSVASITLRPDLFERLSGSPAERRGLDLAIAARVSEMFGGSARLVVEPDRRSTVVLDWPRRLADA